MRNKKRIHIKNKFIFIIMCIFWIVSFVGFGIMIQSVMLATVGMNICTIVAAWQTDMNEGQLTKFVLISLLLILILGSLTSVIPYIISGNTSEAITTVITVLVSLGIIIGLPILLIFLYAKKNSIGCGDPFIKEKQYSTAGLENFL